MGCAEFGPLFSAYSGIEFSSLRCQRLIYLHATFAPTLLSGTKNLP
jgi:hypothetical protein